MAALAGVQRGGQRREKTMLNNIGPAGLLLIAVVVLVLFGRGKIAGLMGEVGKGITAFKRGVKDSTEEIENASTADADGATARDVTPEADRETR
jgi:sec-independent protein translocase protein TatA